jgi:hypothetical protein
MFDFSLPVKQCSPPSRRKTGRLLKQTEMSSLFLPSSLNQQPGFATVAAGWHPDGLGLVFCVSGNPQACAGSSTDVKHSDCALIWIDTRPAGNVQRATEYCHHFACLPSDGQAAGGPAVVVQPIAQQRIQRIDSNPEKMTCRTHSKKDGYELEVWIPGSQLYGFREISELGRLGFYCVVQDTHLGDQPLSVGDDFPTSYNPSTWIQLELQS